ncbi:MAG TPA: ABC transporter permease [Terracidiphilus sp.]|nr:ABC transporter permease [Terracidiphilus sp.]
MADLWNDIKHALHLFFKSPGFTLAAVSALALGIGANTAVFTVVNAVLLKPLGYRDADRLVRIDNMSDQGKYPFASIPNFKMYRQQTSVFSNVAAFDEGGPGFNLTGEHPEQVQGRHVSESYFSLVGAQVYLGRTFTPQEDSPHGGNVVVLSYGLWQRRFGGDASVIGKTLSIADEPYTILGVISRDFRTDQETDLWVPFQFDMNSTNQGHYFQVAARLKPGVTLAQANAQMKLATAEFERLYPQEVGPGYFAVEPLRDGILGDVRQSLLVLLGAVSLVLLISCANVANLLLVRATGRRREFAIRTALGARRSRIVRQLLTESLLLACAGGALGLALGFAGVRALLAVSPAGLPRVGQNDAPVSLDWRILAFTLAASLLTGIVFGLFPALAASRTDLNSTLKESSNRAGTGFRQGKARSMLVVSEVSLALVLLVGAALLIRTFIALRAVDPGFDSHNVLTLEMSLNGDRYKTTAAVAQMVEEGRRRLSALPGVEDSAFSCALPIEAALGQPFSIVGRVPRDPNEILGARWTDISPGYFRVFRIPMLRGRDFTEQDNAGSTPVVILNQAMAKQFWPKGDPLGQQIEIGRADGPQLTDRVRVIVGIVADTHTQGLGLPPAPMMFIPQTQVLDFMTALIAQVIPLEWSVRTHGDPHVLIPQITEQLRIASGGFPMAHVRTMEEIDANSTARQTFNMLLLSIFGAIALVLAAIGIYALMAYSVEQRRQEMGIRMALGADRTVIRRLVVWQGMRLALLGLVLGIGAAFGLTRLISSFLFGVKAWDPTAFIVVPITLGCVALLAVWLPASRASRLDPVKALRVE